MNNHWKLLSNHVDRLVRHFDTLVLVSFGTYQYSPHVLKVLEMKPENLKNELKEDFFIGGGVKYNAHVEALVAVLERNDSDNSHCLLVTNTLPSVNTVRLNTIPSYNGYTASKALVDFTVRNIKLSLITSHPSIQLTDFYESYLKHATGNRIHMKFDKVELFLVDLQLEQSEHPLKTTSNTEPNGDRSTSEIVKHDRIERDEESDLKIQPQDNFVWNGTLDVSRLNLGNSGLLFLTAHALKNPKMKRKVELSEYRASEWPADLKIMNMAPTSSNLVSKSLGNSLFLALAPSAGESPAFRVSNLEIFKDFIGKLASNESVAVVQLSQTLIMLLMHHSGRLVGLLTSVAPVDTPVEAPVPRSIEIMEQVPTPEMLIQQQRKQLKNKTYTLSDYPY